MLSELSAQTIGLVMLGGFLGGIATGAAGFVYGVVASSIWLLLLIGAVSFDRMGAVLLLIAIPAVLLGSWTGWKIFGLLSEQRFRQMLSALLIGSGLLLIF